MAERSDGGERRSRRRGQDRAENKVARKGRKSRERGKDRAVKDQKETKIRNKIGSRRRGQDCAEKQGRAEEDSRARKRKIARKRERSRRRILRGQRSEEDKIARNRLRSSGSGKIARKREIARK